MEQQKIMDTNTINNRVQYNKGENISPVGFIFACPGQKERAAQRVVAGNTGNNLNLLLSSLSKSSNYVIRSLFPSSNRYDYLITNASNIIHYPALDGRSLPSRKEYMSKENIDRLCSEIADLKYIIAFGAQAKDVAQALKIEYKNRGNASSKVFITALPHLSFLSLNQIRFDINGDRILRGDKSATAKRIEVLRTVLEKEILNIERKI